jgi:hypothetical protein
MSQGIAVTLGRKLRRRIPDCYQIVVDFGKIGVHGDA